MSSRPRQWSGALVRYLVRGAIVLTPLATTAYVLWWALATLDQLLPVGIPGLGLVLVLTLVTLVGWLTSSMLGASLVEMTDRRLAKLPLIKLIYSSIKDLIDAFVGDKKRFDQPVAVKLDARGAVRTLGFVTREALEVPGLEGTVAVYLPQSYNFAGNVLIVERRLVEPLGVSSGDMMTFIVSGGVSGFGRGESVFPEEPPTVEMPALQRVRQPHDAPTQLAPMPLWREERPTEPAPTLPASSAAAGPSPPAGAAGSRVEAGPGRSAVEDGETLVERRLEVDPPEPR